MLQEDRNRRLKKGLRLHETTGGWDVMSGQSFKQQTQIQIPEKKKSCGFVIERATAERA